MNNSKQQGPGSGGAVMITEGNEITVSCVKCQGTGWIKVKPPKCPSCLGEGKEFCEDCNGEGSVKCEECNGLGEVECLECGGTGLIDCKYCDGTGFVGKVTTETCPTCHGRGTIQGETCVECFGRGKIEKEPPMCRVCDGKGDVKCDNCVGGKVDCPSCIKGRVTCSTCKGTGKRDCKLCWGTGEIGNERLVKCDLCFGEGERTISITSVSTPQLDQVVQMIYVLQESLEKGMTFTSTQLEAVSRRLEKQNSQQRSKLEEIKASFSDVNEALRELQELQKKALQKDEKRSSQETVELSCPGCGYNPEGALAQKWLENADYDQPINCIVCGTVFKISAIS